MPLRALSFWSILSMDSSANKCPGGGGRLGQSRVDSATTPSRLRSISTSNTNATTNATNNGPTTDGNDGESAPAADDGSAATFPTGVVGAVQRAPRGAAPRQRSSRA